MSLRSNLSSSGSLAVDEAPARFTLATFLKGSVFRIAMALACILLVFGACLVQRISPEGSILVASIVAVCAISSLSFDYVRKRSFYQQLEEASVGIEDACIAASMVNEPDFAEGQVAFDAISSLAKAANEQLSAADRDAEEYRRYIDAWIHDVKTPIAASKLMLSGMHGEEADNLSLEIERIESQVESALFYARSSFLASDYSIGRVELAAVCREACKRNSRFLIASGCTPKVDVPESEFVLADRQWVSFMLSQVTVNSAKYGASQVVFSSSVEEPGTPRERTVLEVSDDGCGIAASDVPRVFEMGFVGGNGRERGGATGLGLYLVARLCEAMGIGVAIASEEGKGTRVIFEFPHDVRRQYVQAK